MDPDNIERIRDLQRELRAAKILEATCIESEVLEIECVDREDRTAEQAIRLRQLKRQQKPLEAVIHRRDGILAEIAARRAWLTNELVSFANEYVRIQGKTVETDQGSR